MCSLSSCFTYVEQIKHSVNRLQLAENSNSEVIDVAHASVTYNSDLTCQRGTVLLGATLLCVYIWSFAAFTKTHPKHTQSIPSPGETKPEVLAQDLTCSFPLLTKMQDPPTVCSLHKNSALQGQLMQTFLTQVMQSRYEVLQPQYNIVNSCSSPHRSTTEMHPTNFLHQHYTHSNTQIS